MNGDVALNILMSRYGNRTDADLRAMTLLEMQAVQQMHCEQNGRFVPWFLLSAETPLTLLSGNTEIALPADFLMELEENGLWYFDGTTRTYLIKDDYDYLLHETQYQTGPPEAYALVGTGLHVFPIPDQNYTLRFRYYAQDALPGDTTGTNLWLTHASDLLIALTGYTVAGAHLRDQNLAALFKADVAPAWDRLWRMHEARAHTLHGYNMGDSE